MRALILGQGAREHALTWKFSRSFRISGLYCAPGNAGTAELATNLPDISETDSGALIQACKREGIDIVFVGGETPLAAGVVDALQEARIAAIGANAAAAQLEASKAISKTFMRRHGVTTAKAETFSEAKPFEEYIRAVKKPVVIKKSGLAAGKGVLETDDKDEMIAFGRETLQDDHVLVEERLSGYEISVFALTDTKSYTLLPPCADYKKAGEGGTGPNTGGMGAICPVPWVNHEVMDEVRRRVVDPTFAGLELDGLQFTGILYFGLMITAEGPKLLEYNVRFGDPEAQVLLPLIKSDFGNLCEAMVEGKLAEFPLELSKKTALGVVLASAGYPGPYRHGIPVDELPANDRKEVMVFHAATVPDGERVLTGGGRCFTVVGIGHELLEARSTAYSAVKRVKFEGAWWRPDIGGTIFGH